MSEISYFQRYSQRENHVTNNTMLMLRHVYQRSPRLIEDVLRGLLEDDEVEIGPRFEQQVGESHSIPDAAITQRSLHVYVEAKRGDSLDDDQIARHVQSIADKGHPKGSSFLVGLTKGAERSADVDRRRVQALEAGVAFASTTYREILDVLGAVCEGDADLEEILADYAAFVATEGLLPDQDRRLVAMLAGQSYDENIAHGIYFEPAGRNAKWLQARYLGLYRQKCIGHVGRIVAAVVCRDTDDGVVADDVEFGSLDDDMRGRIRSVIDAATYYAGFADDPHRYYIVDKFTQTAVRKVSPGGMMGHRYFDIGDLARGKKVPSDSSGEVVAEAIDGATYA